MDKAVGAFEANGKAEAAIIRALARAYGEGVHGKIRDLRTQHGRVTAYIGDDFVNGYRIQIDANLAICSCKAGQAQMTCKHLVAVADKAGAMDLLVSNFYERAFGPSPIDPAPSAAGPIEAARADVVRLSRNPKSTADFHALQNAKAHLASVETAQGDYPNTRELIGLARRAVDHGMTLRVLTTPTRTEHFVHDPRDGSDHYVTGFSCSCRQFIQSGGAGCQHWTFLLVNRGWLPEGVNVAELAVAS